MKRCSDCLEEVEMFADDVAELCEWCIDDIEALELAKGEDNQ